MKHFMGQVTQIGDKMKTGLGLSVTNLNDIESAGHVGSGNNASSSDDEESQLFARMGSTMSLTHQQRAIGFVGFLVGSALCFLLAFLLLPFLAVKPRKFFLLFSLGSVFAMSALAMLRGPWAHLLHVFNADRLPFTSLYFGSLFLTLYAAMSLQSALLTLICGAAQVVTLSWYVLSYVPGGMTGMRILWRISYSAAVMFLTQFVLSK